MEKYDIYKDISVRTGGDIYIGVVGPVRTGKSTLINKFMENIVLPNIGNKLLKKIATDEMPQSAGGKTIMTTEPKFVPANAVKVTFKNKASAMVRLVDCVGYLVEGATGHEEDGKPRQIKTPWSVEEMPFERAAEIGTEKVIKDYSTIGIVVTTDGSFTDIDRQNYVKAEERVVNELKGLKKPFVIVLNSKNPTIESTQRLAFDLENKYGVSVVCKDVSNLNADDISQIMEKVLLEFPMTSFNVDLPEWIRALPADSEIIKKITSKLKDESMQIEKMRDFASLYSTFSDDDDFFAPELKELMFDKGISNYKLEAKEGLFYRVLSTECGENISNEYELLHKFKNYSKSAKEYEKVKNALIGAENFGYGIVEPSICDMQLEEPSLVKKGSSYGVKLKAKAPSYHIVKVDVEAEVSPMVGSQKQGEELSNSLLQKHQENPDEMWNTNVFGKSLKELVKEGLNNKILGVPENVKGKLKKTLTRIVNEKRGGIVCILL